MRGQLVVSQQAERLAMEQLAVQRPSVTPMVEQLSATSIPPMGRGAQQLGLIAPAPRKRLPDISKFDGSRKGYPMYKVEADNKLQIDWAVIGTPCRTPLLEECPQHHGHKGDPGVMPGTCSTIGERAQVILV